MEERIRQALCAVSTKENGARALDILNMSVYFIPARNIHMEIFSCLPCNNEELKVAIRLLKQHLLIESEERSTTYIVKKTVQMTLRMILKEQGKERIVLWQAITLFSKLVKEVTHPSTLDHAMSVLAFASEHEDLVKIATALPSIIIMRLMKQNKLEEAYSYGMKALHFFEKKLETHAETLTLQHNLATILAMQGKHADTIRILECLYENDRDVSGSEEITHTLVTGARQLCELSKYDEALRVYQILIAKGKVTDTLDNTILTAWHDYAILLHDIGNYSEAFDILQDVLTQRMKILSVEDNEILQVRCSMATVLMGQKNYNQALYHYRDVLDTRRQLLGELHPDTLRTRREIGMVHQFNADYDEALKILQDVAQKFTQVVGASHPDVLSTKANIAAILINQNKYDKALEISNDVYCKYKNTLGEKHNETLRVKSNIGAIYLRQKKVTEAIETFQEVFDGFSEVFGSNHDLTRDAKATLDVLRLSQTIENIHLGAKNGDLHRISKLIQNGADVNEEDYIGRRPLHYAALHSHVNVVKYLLKKCAMYNAKDSKGETPLQLATDSEIKKMLIFAKNLFKDVKEGNYKNVARCISENTYIVNIKDKDGYCLLHWATYKHHLQIVKQLLNADADARCTSNKGNTPLHIAASTGQTEIAKILLQSINENDLQEFINAKTTTGGNTALHVAAQNGNLKMVTYLLKYGAACNVQNANNETPINLAKDQTISDLLKI